MLHVLFDPVLVRSVRGAPVNELRGVGPLGRCALRTRVRQCIHARNAEPTLTHMHDTDDPFDCAQIQRVTHRV